MEQEIIYVNCHKNWDRELDFSNYDKVFILNDSNTFKYCYPLIEISMGSAIPITIPNGDENKNLATLELVLMSLEQNMATRHSLLINLGGGVVTDLGGFAASIFKRGIAFINIPTTLLSMVDAAVGGKTGVNYRKLKNELGVFSLAKKVIINTAFLNTLPFDELRSGYAEMIKHALLEGGDLWYNHLNFDLSRPDFSKLECMIQQSIEIKNKIVKEDPNEQGLRKILNAGHTLGHAFESYALVRKQVGLHGLFVIWGLIAELFLSIKKGFPSKELRSILNFTKENYPKLPLQCTDYNDLYKIMLHDKKNHHGKINFTLFENIGRPIINQQVDKNEIFEALDFIREC